MRKLPTAPNDTTTRGQGRRKQLAPGETAVGRVARLPQPGRPFGHSLFLRTDAGELLAIPATAKQGHTVLERELGRTRAAVGDEVAITYQGKRLTVDGERSYRAYEVRVWEVGSP